MAPTIAPKAFLFDVFGTCVNWRPSVAAALRSATQRALDDPARSLPPAVRAAALQTDWPAFAQRWRNSYLAFVYKLATDPSHPWSSVDAHHHASLLTFLADAGLTPLFTPQEVQELSLVWHRLAPWSDAAAGIAALNSVAVTATLSNGNLALLDDLVAFGRLPFTRVLSAEMFESYKPSPKVYLGAVEALGLRPEECALVAAHLGDLEAARRCGLRTVYVERRGEEGWAEEKVAAARREGWVDVWVPLTEKDESGREVELEGFVTVAERLGVDVGKAKGSSL